MEDHSIGPTNFQEGQLPLQQCYSKVVVAAKGTQFPANCAVE